MDDDAVVKVASMRITLLDTDGRTWEVEAGAGKFFADVEYEQDEPTFWSPEIAPRRQPVKALTFTLESPQADEDGVYFRVFHETG